MNNDLLAHVAKYYGIYLFIAEQKRNEDVLSEYMKDELSMGDSTVRTFIREVKNGKHELIRMDQGYFFINPAKAQVLLDEVLKILSLPRDDETISKIAEQNSVLESENQKLREELAALKKEKRKLKESVNKLESELTEQKKLIPNYTYQSMNQKILILQSVEIGPKKAKEEGMFLEDIDVVVDLEPETESFERESFYSNQDSNKELTEEKYHRKSMLRIVTERLLQKSCSENAVLDKRPDKLDEFRRKRQEVVQSIADNKQLTNQEKLALYAFYSKHHGKDMENLLNFAGDNCVNANLLIQLLESPGRACDNEKLQALLRQFAKASEFRVKYDFAKEMIAGKWYIKADYNGHITNFQLVPVEEMNELRKAIGLSEISAGCVKNEEQTEKRDEGSVQQKEMSRFNCLDDSDSEIPDIPCENMSEDGDTDES